MAVPDWVKAACNEDNVFKYLTIRFPNGEYSDIPPECIKAESFSLKQSLCSSGKLKYGLCEATTAELTVYGLSKSIKGATIEILLTIVAADSSYTISFGQFIVDSSKKDAKDGSRTIVAYDGLYSANLGQQARKAIGDYAPKTYDELLVALLSNDNNKGTNVFEKLATETQNFYIFDTFAEEIYSNPEADTYVNVFPPWAVRKDITYLPVERIDKNKQLYCKVTYDPFEMANFVDAVNRALKNNGVDKNYTVSSFLNEHHVGICLFGTGKYEGYTLSMKKGRDEDHLENNSIYANSLVNFDPDIEVGEVMRTLRGLAVCDELNCYQDDYRKYYKIVQSADFYYYKGTETINTFSPAQIASFVNYLQYSGESCRNALEALLEIQGVFGSYDGNGFVLKSFDEFSETLKAETVLTSEYVLGSGLDEANHFYLSEMESCYYDDEELGKVLSGVIFNGKIGGKDVEVIYSEGVNGYGYYDLTSNVFLTCLCDDELITEDELVNICRNLYTKIQTVAFSNVNVVARSRPWLRTGERIVVHDGETVINAYIMEKITEGIISITDEIASDTQV